MMALGVPRRGANSELSGAHWVIFAEHAGKVSVSGQRELSDFDEAEYPSPETEIQAAAKITRTDNPAAAVFVMALVTALKGLQCPQVSFPGEMGE